MGVEEPHQPRGPRFRAPYKEEHGHDLVRRAWRGDPGRGGLRQRGSPFPWSTSFRRSRAPTSIAGEAYLEFHERLYVPRYLEGRAVLEDRHPGVLLSRVVATSIVRCSHKNPIPTRCVLRGLATR